MPTPTFLDYLIYIKKQEIRPGLKLEWLNSDFTVAKTIEHDLLQTSGNLTINFDDIGERRSLNLILYNVNKTYNVNINKLWFAQAIKLYLGIYIGNDPYYIPQGIFYITNPQSISNTSEKTMVIQAIDKKSLLDGTIFGTLGFIYEIPVSTNIYSAMQSILDLDRGNGTVLDSMSPNFSSYYVGKTTILPDSTVVNRIETPYTLRAERNSTYWNVLEELAKMLGALIYYNEHGQLTVEPSQEELDDSLKPSLFDYTTERFEYLGSTTQHLMSNIYNTIIITGDTIQGDTASAKVSNTNPLSDTCVQKIGEKILSIEDTAYYSDELAEEYGKYLLKRKTVLQKANTINSSPIYHLKSNSIITLTDNYLDFNKERFLIQSINIPLEIGGQMQITATSVNELVFE